MTEQTHRLLIGSAGWQHAAWQESYYPEDLPSEWRLGYYSNEFPLVVITDRERADEEELLEAMQDCREDLWVLLCVAPQAGDPQPALESAAALLARLPRPGGVLLQVDPAAQPDPEVVLGAATARLAGWPLCLDPASLLSESWREALRRHSIGWSWNAHGDADGLPLGPLAVIRLASDTPAKEVRERMQAGLAVSTPQRHVALVFDGQPPQVEALRQARLIEELL